MTHSNRQLLTLQAILHLEAGRSRKPMNGLMARLVDGRNLEAAFQKVSSANGAGTPGLDGLVCGDLADQVHPWLSLLSEDLYGGRYQPGPARRVQISANGKTREIAVLTVRDRVVHTAVKQILEPIFERSFHPRSFAFRPGRSVPAALEQARRDASTLGSADVHAAVCDVVQFFPSVDHPILVDALRRRIGDESFMELLAKIVRVQAESVPVHLSWLRQPRRRGLSQGSALSPLLSNIYLDSLDHGFESAMRGRRLRMLRYADDILVLSDSASAVRAAVRWLRRDARQLRIQISGGKATPLRGAGFCWLGARFHQTFEPGTRQALVVHSIPEEKILSMLDRLDILTQPPCRKIDPGAFRAGPWIQSVNEQLTAWCQAYRFADNRLQVFQVIDRHARAGVARLLRALAGQGGGRLSTTHRVRLAGGFETIEVDGVCLVQLSSRRPHAPRRLIRRAPWAHRQNQVDRAEQRNERGVA